MSTQIIKPVRSISYNQIKKRRMLRQSKSKHKLKSSQASTEIIHTQKKVYPNQYPPFKIDLYAKQRPNQINQIRQIKLLQSSYANQIKDTVKRKISNNYTDRVLSKNQQIMESREQGQDQVEFSCAKSREVVKQLIQESKSERKLVLYRNLRNKFKQSKSKSRSQSKSAKSLIEKSRVLAKRLMQIDDITPQKPQSSPSKGIKNCNRVKRFQSINQNIKLLNHNFRYLVNVPRQSSRQHPKIIKKQMQMKTIDNLQSSIQLKKQSSIFNQSDDKFLEQMCLKPSKSHQITIATNQQKNQENFTKQKIEIVKKKDKQKNKYKTKNNKQKSIIEDNQSFDDLSNRNSKKQRKNKQQKKQDKKLNEKQKQKEKFASIKSSHNNSNFNENLLDLLDVQQRDISKVLGKKQRQKKIMKDLQKLNKRFPKGFFKL